MSFIKTHKERDLEDLELVEQILNGTDPSEVNQARKELFRRNWPTFVRRSKVACGRMAHGGSTCSGFSERTPCEHTFNSALSKTAEKAVDPRVVFVTWNREIEFQERRRTSKHPYKLLKDWREQEDHTLSQFIGQEVKLMKDADIRQRWNEDRGLRVTMNLPKGVAERFDEILEQHTREPKMADLLALMDCSKPKRDAKRWAQWIYDDLCDRLPEGSEVPEVEPTRLARRAFPEKTEAEIDELVQSGEAGRLFKTILLVIENAADDLGNTAFYKDYFDSAIAQTRQPTRALGDMDRLLRPEGGPEGRRR